MIVNVFLVTSCEQNSHAALSSVIPTEDPQPVELSALQQWFTIPVLFKNREGLSCS